MSESDDTTTRWEQALSEVKASGSPTGSPVGAKPDPKEVAQIVGAVKQKRLEWILGLWRSLAMRAVFLAAVLLVIAALVLWNRKDRSESPPQIIPAPALDGIGTVDEKEVVAP